MSRLCEMKKYTGGNSTQQEMAMSFSTPFVFSCRAPQHLNVVPTSRRHLVGARRVKGNMQQQPSLSLRTARRNQFVHDFSSHSLTVQTMCEVSGGPRRQTTNKHLGLYPGRRCRLQNFEQIIPKRGKLSDGMWLGGGAEKRDYSQHCPTIVPPPSR